VTKQEAGGDAHGDDDVGDHPAVEATLKAGWALHRAVVEGNASAMGGLDIPVIKSPDHAVL
jgi:hypothetical protein